MIKSCRLRSTLAGFAGMSALMLISGAAHAEMRLGMDQVRILTLKEPFKAVSVGNPLIADATIIDENHLFIVGREFGTTNVIAVDAEGNQVAEELITVTTQAGTMVTLTRGTTATGTTILPAGQDTLTCNAGRCDVRPTPGDETTRYRNDTTAIQIREQQATRAAATPVLAPQ